MAGLTIASSFFGLLRSAPGTAFPSKPNEASATTYADYVSRFCTPVQAGLEKTCNAAKAADGGGKAAIFFFSFSMLFMLIAAISMSVNAHNKLGKTPPANQVLKALGSPLMSLIFLGAALAVHVIGCACAWGTIGGLADTVQQQNGGIFQIPVPEPGAGLAGWTLFLLFLSLILEVSSRSCCKDWKPPTSAAAAGGTTIVVTSPVMQAQPMFAVPPPQAGGWLRQTELVAPAARARRPPPRSPPRKSTQALTTFPPHAQPRHFANPQREGHVVFQPRDKGNSVAAPAGGRGGGLKKWWRKDPRFCVFLVV